MTFCLQRKLGENSKPTKIIKKMKPTVLTQKNPGVFSGQISNLADFWTLKVKSISTAWKLKSLLVPMAALTSLTGCQESDDLVPKNPVNGRMDHQIEFRVMKAKDYSEEVYDGAMATLNLTISLENLVDGENTVLWDTVFELREIREFPAPEDALLIRKNISQIADANEVLRLSNTARYFDRNNNTWMAAEGEIVPRDFRLVKVDVVL